METVRTRASESIVFGLKSTKKSTKVVKKRWCICSGTGGREFESRHFDQKYGESIALPIFLFVVPRLDKFRVAECECAYSAQSARCSHQCGKLNNFAGECVKLACKPSAKLFFRRQSPHSKRIINSQVRNRRHFSPLFEHLTAFFEILQLQVAFFVIILFKSIDFYHII